MPSCIHRLPRLITSMCTLKEFADSMQHCKGITLQKQVVALTHAARIISVAASILNHACPVGLLFQTEESIRLSPASICSYNSMYLEVQMHYNSLISHSRNLEVQLHYNSLVSNSTNLEVQSHFKPLNFQFQESRSAVTL